MSARRKGFLGLAVLALLLCSACQVTIAVGVDATQNGSGVVRAGVGLDDDALRQIPDLAQQLRVDDLKRAGWTVVGPRRESDNRTWVRASKPFANPPGAARAMTELNGPNGPFKGFRLTIEHPFLRTRTTFTGTVDRVGARGLADPTLQQQLGGSGVDPKVLEQQLNELIDRSVRTEVVAHLPGSISSNAPTVVSGGVVWHPTAGEQAHLLAASTAWNLRPIFFGGVALVLAAVAAVLWRRSRRRVTVTPPS
ncbi:MAG: DUF3153 domain-containing protein [Acidimicrobiia bacterium]|nr:DUF3153 domain-containing protein [Acidimicrobiia bacterium]